MKAEERSHFNALMKLAEFRRNLRVHRQQTEWKITLGVWALLAAATIYTKGQPFWIVAIGVMVIVFGHGWLWVRWNWISNERDIRLAHFYAETAEKMLFPDIRPEKRLPMTTKEQLFGVFGHGPPTFQFAGSLVLAIATILFRWIEKVN